MTLRVYTGEFLVSPIPMEWSANWCSHGCWYCFANLNKPNRRFNGSWIPAVKRALETGEPTSNLTRILVDGGYPILASNLVDPFAKSNVEHFRETRRLLGNRVRWSYQTKGGHDRALIDECIDEPPTMWYVSITSDSDQRSIEIEPGAPPYSDRLRLIERLKAARHHVVVGMNPFVQAYFNDPFDCIDQLMALGVRHFWLQRIHLSPKQQANIPEKKRQQHAEVVKEAGRRYPPQEEVQLILSIEDYIKSAGGKVFDTPSPSTDFWQDYYALGFKRWPTIEDFLFELDQLHPDPNDMIEFSFDDFAVWVIRQTQHVLENSSFMEMFVQPFRSKLKFIPELRRYAHPRSMVEALEATWIWDQTHSRLRHPYIAIAVEDEGRVIRTDEEGRHLLVYTRASRDDEYVDVPRARVVPLDPPW